MRRLTLTTERWPIAGRFTIARGSKTEAVVIVVELVENGSVGRGECVPYARYGESADAVAAAIERLRPALEHGLDRAALQHALPAGAARNAIDCALWDLAAKQKAQPAWALAGLPAPTPLVSAYTLSVDTPDAMGAAALRQAGRPLLKLKLSGTDGDLDRVRAVRANAPSARLIVDANEAWTPASFTAQVGDLAALGVELIEQPLPAGDDAALAHLPRPVPVCADESCHDTASLRALAGRYDAINIKLDKTGGLTEALRLAAAATAQGFDLMVGCMVATSLAMAPAMLVAGQARWVDLDGPLLLTRDREPGLTFHGSRIDPAASALWG